ncbi:hypothetical protein Syun_012496 [Stephania yunnanensis]|uniref:Uncharacterized protein n=1 Tax=Stephania yunnanensis TaxID=152371 RepID=A0AAP0PJI9_9MAGN
MAVHHSSRFVFCLILAASSPSRTPPPPATKQQIPKSFPRKNPKNLNPSLRLVAPVDRLVPRRPSRSIVSSLRLVVRAGLSGALLWPSVRGGLRFSVWSCYTVALLVSLSRRLSGLSVSSRRSPSSPISLALSGL